MKNSYRIRQFSAATIVAAAVCPLLVACSTLNMEDLAPQQPAVVSASQAPLQAPTHPGQGQPQPAQATLPATAADQAAQARRPGDYPNLNIPVQPAAEQISDEERQRIIDELNAKRKAASGPSASQLSEADRLRLLARQHQEEILSEIESEQ